MIYKRQIIIKDFGDTLAYKDYVWNLKDLKELVLNFKRHRKVWKSI